MQNQWKNQWTINEKPLFLNVYVKPKPAKIWKTNENNENQWKTHKHQLFLTIYGKPKPAH